MFLIILFVVVGGGDVIVLLLALRFCVCVGCASRGGVDVYIYIWVGHHSGSAVVVDC